MTLTRSFLEEKTKKVAAGGDLQRAVARHESDERLRGDSAVTRCEAGLVDVAHARTEAGASVTARGFDSSSRCVVGDAHRAITDDDLLRFFAVYETAGMLG
jgi:hypothetical protein